jgi:hypothetical protein
MKINSISEFFNFTKNYGLINIHPEISAFSRCMEEFSRMCPCDPGTAKVSKINKCKAMYINFIYKAPQFKEMFLSKVADKSIEFYIDGRCALTLTR